VIRGASPTERPLARALLPEAFAEALEPEVLLAAQGRPARVLGAAAVVTAAVRGRLIARVAMRVVQPERRRGVGSALLERAMARARAHGARAIETWTEVESGGAAAAFCERLGLGPGRTLERYEATGDQLERHLSGLVRRLRERGRIPAEALVAPLSAGDVEAVARLVTDQIGGRVGAVRKRLEALAGDARERSGLSMVARRGPDLAGALLVDLEGEDVAVVRSRVVAPGQRGGWVNAVLLAAALRRGVAKGLRRMAFVAATENADTIKLARRAGARVVSARCVFARAL
jgi:GNAT superfamily N-acetyltransferase